MKWSLLNSSVFTIYHVVTVQWITADYFADVVFYLFRDALLRRTILLASLDKSNVCLYGCARMLLYIQENILIQTRMLIKSISVLIRINERKKKKKHVFGSASKMKIERKLNN